MIKVLHIGASDSRGGAARGSYRVHRALVDHGNLLGISSRFLVNHKQTRDPTVIDSRAERRTGTLSRAKTLLRSAIRRAVFAKFRSDNPITHSIACLSYGLNSTLNRVRKDAAEIVMLHWVADDALSIEEIGKLKGPIVWRLPDQWPFCGAEHYTAPPKPNESKSNDRRFALGYTRESRAPTEGGFDVNRWVWRRKQRAWRTPMHIVCNTKWMADHVRDSALMRNWPVSVIPNPIDLEAYAPADKDECRRMLGLPTDRPLVLFGADSGAHDPRKGADLLMDALIALRKAVADTPMASVELVIFGPKKGAMADESGFPMHFVGHIHETDVLRRLYAAADVFVMPSRQESFGNSAAEAQACGTPVVTFADSGTAEIIEDGKTGKLATPFSPTSLSEAIHWILEDAARNRDLGRAARIRAEELFDPRRVAALYAQVYRQALAT